MRSEIKREESLFFGCFGWVEDFGFFWGDCCGDFVGGRY